MNEVPIVSIVVAAYNEERNLGRCIHSLLAQSNKSIEIIVVNDGSTDGTQTLVQELAGRDSRVRAIHQQNQGLSAARNAGLRMACGEFVCFLDGDDWVDPDMVSSMVAECQRTGSQVAIAGMHVDYHDRSDRLLRSERRVPPTLEIRRGVPFRFDAVDRNFVNLLGYAWNKIYSREWLLQLGVEFEEGLSLIEDIEFNAEVLASAEKVAFIAKAFVHYVQRPRLTLGTTFDKTFLAKRMRAIECQDFLLEAWGIDERSRTELKTRASGVALWQGLRAASTHSKSRDYLRWMVDQPDAARLVQLAVGWRSSWAAFMLRRRYYGLALLPARLMLPVDRLIGSIRRQRRQPTSE